MKVIGELACLLCSFVLCTVALAQTKNGFDLSDASVPADQIRRGGVPRDGIPAIDNPEFIDAADADFLRSKDRILGVFRNGVAKAYPIRILDYHEIVNDHIGDEAILVSYCPLCYTGMVFSVQGSDVAFNFGVSGLLYNSDVLLYDRETGSLWSQILSKAIAGPLKNVVLPPVPASNTTWREWRERHPDTLVLSTDTGYRRNYRQSPYIDYARMNRLMFPVEHRNDEYGNKDLVLGITLDSRARAYPFRELGEQDIERFEDTIGDRTITIEWLESENFARILDDEGEELPSVIAYWFAWYAFHPDTEIFRADDSN